MKAVVVELDELISRIKADHEFQKKIQEPLSFNNIYSSYKSTKEVDGDFVFSQVLIDCLLRLKFTETDKNELIRCCKSEYKDNHTELNNIRDFRRNYSPDKVLWWYSRESFFYKTLNAALRTPNIHMMFLFRAFICDIHCQLQRYQARRELRVYRSQLITIDELETLKQCCGQLISINSFFSTSTDYSTALSSIDASNVSTDLERVLFDIKADPKVVTAKPFADITDHTEYDESEVLFMLGSIFLLESINLNADRIWIIRMTLSNDDEHDLKQVLNDMKKQNGNGETNLRILGKILWDMGEHDLAEKYFIRLLKQLQGNDPLRIELYEDLGKLSSQRKNSDKSMYSRKKVSAFKE